MKNKIRLIDVTIVSTYMGRFLTAIVTAIVLAITVSALVSDGGIRGHGTLLLEVPQVGGQQETVDYYEPLRYLLAAQTGRSVAIQMRGGGARDRCELFLLPIAEFLAYRKVEDLVPLYEIGRMERVHDEAIVIARHRDSETVPMTPDNVVFTHPRSINGFWVQLAMLDSSGFAAPDEIASLQFATVPGATAAPGRVVFSVLMGEYAYGACRRSDLASLIEAGEVHSDELRVVESRPAAPELIVACRPVDARYYRRVLERTSATIALTESSERESSAVELLRSRGMKSLRPVSPEELERAAALYDEMRGRF